MNRFLTRLALTLTFVLSAIGSPAQTELPTPKAQLEQAVGLDVSLPQLRADGKAEMLNLKEAKGPKNLVLFFLSEQCGVTFYYKSRLQQMQKDFEGRGFAFVGIRGGKKQKPDAPVELAEWKYLKMPFADDTDGTLVRRFGVRQSLMFAVIDKAGKLRYRGGFDDNVDEKRVRKPYLRNALTALATGKPIAVREGNAIGCALVPIP